MILLKMSDDLDSGQNIIIKKTQDNLEFNYIIYSLSIKNVWQSLV